MFKEKRLEYLVQIEKELEGLLEELNSVELKIPNKGFLEPREKSR